MPNMKSAEKICVNMWQTKQLILLSLCICVAVWGAILSCWAPSPILPISAAYWHCQPQILLEKKSQCNLEQLASHVVRGMRWENDARKGQVTTRVSGRSAATWHQPHAIYHKLWFLQRGWRTEASFAWLNFMLGCLSWCCGPVPLAKEQKSIPSTLNKDKEEAIHCNNLWSMYFFLLHVASGKALAKRACLEHQHFFFICCFVLRGLSVVASLSGRRSNSSSSFRSKVGCHLNKMMHMYGASQPPCWEGITNN